MANKDLFKQAIAEAKSVREAAIANAKEALEETLTPHLKDMLAAKLQEMDDSSVEEEVVNEVEDMEEGDYSKNNEGEVYEEDLAEMDEDEEAAEEPADDDSEESEEEAEEDLEVKDMEVNDLKDLIRDIIAQEMGAEGEEEVPAEELPMADDMVGAEDEEEIDLDELLKEITEMSEEDNNEEVNETESIEEVEDIEEVVDPVTVGAGVAALFGGAAGLNMLVNKLKNGDFGDKGKKLAMGLEKAAGSAKSSTQKHENIEELDIEETNELDLAMETIGELKAQLQEVNLLNAKLLYVNKVFKANSLSESQKVSVIAAFDKAETVKEVKLVFETVSDNVVVKSTKGSIKESKLGMASKATGVTASKPEIILEVSDAVKRMQKLAGIIK